MDGAIGRFARFDIQLLQKRAEAHTRPLLADADAHGPILVVNAHGDDCALEARVGHSGHGQKQLARQETRLVHSIDFEPTKRPSQDLRNSRS
jgi:hypothetical protein